MTQETPAKVLSLLGVALASMAFLFSVSVTDASFAGTTVAVADPFAPDKIISLIDNTAHNYSLALHSYVIDSGAQDFAMAADNLSWIASNAKDGFIAMAGLDKSNATVVAYASGSQGQVAGAYTEAPYRETSALHSLLIALGLE